MKETGQTSGLVARCYKCHAALEREWRHCPNCGQMTLQHSPTITLSSGNIALTTGDKKP